MKRPPPFARNGVAIRIAFALLAACASAIGARADTQAPLAETSLTLLGTAGGPGGRVNRAGIATLVRVGESNYLVDAGEGVSRQLARAGVSERQIPIVFLTHLHDDHTAGLPSLMTFAYTLRSERMEVIGPPGTGDLVKAAAALLQSSAEIRMHENKLPLAPSSFLHAREVQPGVIYQDERVRVTAVENTHFHLPAGTRAARHRSYALKFEAPGRVIVFTGDTGPSEAVEKLAHGADVLIAEMVSSKDRQLVPPVVLEHMDKEHLSPAEVGKLAAKAGVKMLVLSHIGEVGPEDVEAVRRRFDGKIVVGEDLQKL